MFANLAEFLNSKLPMEVTLWNPFDKMQCHAGRNHRGVLLKNVLHKSGPAMAVAAGLAMRSI
jgi:Tfp pilus assembly PilM family ATPase